jgi:NitT/TauT family transport system substrate-binding protein
MGIIEPGGVNLLKLARVVLASLLLAASTEGAHAEVAKITIGIQNGMAYLPLQVMAAQHLVEKHARRLGVSLSADIRNLGATGFVRDALIAEQIQFGVAGPPTLITLFDKTRGRFRAVSAVAGIPTFLNTTNPKIRTVCDFAGNDRIAVPTVKVSAQAVLLQMASKQKCGQPFRNDRYAISMPHPDAYNALMTGLISTHIASPPYSEMERERGKGKVRTILSSYDVLKARPTLVYLIASQSFRKTNPRVYRAVREALEEGEAFVRAHPEQAAEIYVKAEKSKESLASLVRQITSRDSAYTTTPVGLGRFADFLYEIGTVKKRYTWRDLSMPELAGRKGS